mgnify:CR=1 FL=1
MNFNAGNYTREGELEKSIETYIAKWEVEYGKDPLETTIGDRFKGVLQRGRQKTGLVSRTD